MNLTASDLRALFRRFNAQYFDGQLPEPRLAVSNSRTQLGQFSLRRRRKLFGWETYGYTIKVSEYYEQTAAEVEDTLLHEMIHYLLAWKGVRDKSAHGPRFRAEMERLNRLGRHITVSARTDGLTVSRQNVRSHYLLLLLETTDGRQLMSVVNPAYRHFLDRQASQSPLISRHEWRLSADAYFATFPQVRSLRGRLLTDELRRHLPQETAKEPA